MNRTFITGAAITLPYRLLGSTHAAAPFGAALGRRDRPQRDQLRELRLRSFPSNPWGLHEMVGNLAKMVADCKPTVNTWTEVPKDGGPIATHRVTTADNLRSEWGNGFMSMGGAWLSKIDAKIDRGWFSDKNTGSLIGIRLAPTWSASAK